jgi:hypothetical protein
MRKMTRQGKNSVETNPAQMSVTSCKPYGTIHFRRRSRVAVQPRFDRVSEPGKNCRVGVVEKIDALG